MYFREGMIIELFGEKYFVLEASGAFYLSNAYLPEDGEYYPPNEITLRKVVDYG